MRNFFLLGLMLAFANSNVEAEQVSSNQTINLSEINNIHEKSNTCQPQKGSKKHKEPSGCKGLTGRKGPKGPKGHRGNRGRQGAFLEINDYLEATTRRNGVVEIGLLTFDPIDYSSTGIDSFLTDGMALVESVPGSNNFDTITLPKKDKATIYSVTYGVSCGIGESEFDPQGGNFVLVLNGNILNYTSLGINDNGLDRMISRTVIVRNPANTKGTLSLFCSVATTLGSATESGFTNYITVVKLNQNGN